MKHFYKLKTALTLALIILGTTLFAQDVTFSFQGILKNFDGTVVLDGGYSMKFVIYDAATGGNDKWEETQIGVQVTGGVYNTVLGKVNQAALAALPFTENYWVGVTVLSGNNPLEMTPRMKMTGSAYNYRSKLADVATVAEGLTAGVHTAHVTQADTAGHAETATLAYALQAGGPTVPIWATGVPIESGDGQKRMYFQNNGATEIWTPGELLLSTTGTYPLDFRHVNLGVPTTQWKVEWNGAMKMKSDEWHKNLGSEHGRFYFADNGSTQFGTGASSGPAYQFKAGTSPYASVFTIDNNGAITMSSGVWHTDMGSGHGRFYFATNGSTQFGTGASGSNPAWHFQTATSTAFAIGNDGAITFTAGVWHKSSDGFHRILFNLNQSTHYDAPLGHGHYFEAGGVNIGIINASGGTFSSDRRFKANIKPLENALANVLQLEGVSFNWNKKKFADEQLRRPNHIGVIAQDLEKIYPEFVVTGEDGYKYVNYAQLTAVLIEAIKELNVIVENQVTKIENQDNKIDNLKADNGELKKDNSSNEARLLKLEEYLQLTTKK